jgi:hypothetical protein
MIDQMKTDASEENLRCLRRPQLEVKEVLKQIYTSEIFSSLETSSDLSISIISDKSYLHRPQKA